MDSRWLGVIVVIIIIAVGGWYLFSNQPADTGITESQSGEATGTDTGPTPAGATVPAPVTVTYTDDGFSPKDVTVAEGQTVTWVNESSGTMWVASAMHPDHTAYDGSTRSAHCAADYAGEPPFDACEGVDEGGSYSFTFTKGGTWKYHNHANSSDFGSVTVTEPAIEGTASSSVNAAL